MPFTSQVQPLCRYCAKPIKKHVVTHYFGSNSGLGVDGWSQHHAEEAKTKAEAQRHVNGRIVSVRYGYEGNIIVGVWDGESYVDSHFCRGECARDFAYAAIRHRSDLAMPCYHEAIAARGGR